MSEIEENFIHGIGISGFRSFGLAMQQIGPFKKINLIIGQNNSGKSNVLRFIHEHYNRLRKAVEDKDRFELAGLDAFQTTTPFERQYCIAGKRGARFQAFNALLDKSDSTRSLIEKIIGAGILRGDQNLHWLDITAKPTYSEVIWQDRIVDSLATQKAWDTPIRDVLATVQHRVVDDSRANANELLRWLFFHTTSPIYSIFVPAFRRVGAAKETTGDYTGADIVQRLAKLQNPSYNRQELKQDFRKVEALLREVTDRPDAKLEIPYDRDTVIVHMDKRSLPLESLGTGIHEVIILAAIATVFSRRVFCIEEPELHLHPLLQRKLLRFLHEQTDNQYIFSTHSAHMLDDPNAAVFHVQLTDSGSNVLSAENAAAKFGICTDLGYKASDLLQSNCVIWVEGPSDRIYIRHWIENANPDLVEGTHYSIMFYGGRLLNHLSSKDPEIDDFISLRRLNRNMVLIMDSDKENEAATLNGTKERIIDQWEAPGFVWVTSGREIENYVDWESFAAALNAIAPKQKHAPPSSEYGRCIGQDAKGKPLADKLKIAHWLVNNGQPPSNILGLKDQTRKLVQFIESCNHKPTKPQSSDNNRDGV